MRPQDGARNPWSAPTTELWAPTGCLPEHAVGMLSVARHLLDVPGVVIVLGVNHSELCHRVRSVHGAGCDAETYLRRFVDLPVDLGVVGTAQLDRFLNGRFEAAGIRDRFTSSEGWFLSEMIKLLAQQAGMSLQDIEQVVHRAALTLGSIAEPKSEAERAEVKPDDLDLDGISVASAATGDDGAPAYGFAGTINAAGTDVPIDYAHPGISPLSEQRVDGRPYVQRTRIRSAASSGVGACSGCGGLWRRSTGRGLRRRA